jgi:hypothetical protein
MISYDALPELYGKEALNPAFVEGAKIMADFWSRLSRLSERIDPGSVDAECAQLVMASRAAEFIRPFTVGQISDFREGLENYLLKTGVSMVSMDHQPNIALLVAGSEAGIGVGTLNLPSKTSTEYQDCCVVGNLNKPAVIVCSDGSRPIGVPIVVPSPEADAVGLQLSAPPVPAKAYAGTDRSRYQHELQGEQIPKVGRKQLKGGLGLNSGNATTPEAKL